MQDDVNPHILHMVEDTFSLNSVHIMRKHATSITTTNSNH